MSYSNNSNHLQKSSGLRKLDIFGKHRRQLEREVIDLRNQQAQHEHQQRLLEYENQRTKQKYETERAEQLRKEKTREEKRKKAELLRKEEEKRRRDIEKERIFKLSQTTPIALRGLRDLIRKKYELDVSIWGLRGARGPDRPIVVGMMRESDEILRDMREIVGTWGFDDRGTGNGNDGDNSWTAEEWELAERVKELVLLDGKRVWSGNPPWNER